MSVSTVVDRDGDQVGPALRDFRAWTRGTVRTTALLTGLSFASTAIVGSLLVIAQRAIQGGTVPVPIPGVGAIPEVPWLGSGLPALLLALAAWTAMSSLSHLAQAAIVRAHLRRLSLEPQARGGELSDSDARDDLSTSDGADGDDETGIGRSDYMTERILLDSYLSVVTSMTRALALSIVLVVLQPQEATMGLVVCWLIASVLGVRRVRRGAATAIEFVALTREVRRGEQEQTVLIDAIYERDRRISRLPLGQAAVITLAALLLVLLPVWLLTSPPPVAALLLVVMWLPTMGGGLAELGPLGWRVGTAYARQPVRPTTAPDGSGQESPTPTSEQPPAEDTRPRVGVSAMPIQGWNGRSPLWVRLPGADRTAVLVVATDARVGPWGALAAARLLAGLGWNVLAVDETVANGSPLLPGETEPGVRLDPYLAGGPVLVLGGGELGGAAVTLARRMSGAVAVIIDGSTSADGAAVSVSADEIQRMMVDGSLGRTLAAWADPEAGSAEGGRGPARPGGL